MARHDFTVLLDLQDYFSDDRQHSKIYVNRHCSTISDLEGKISELFGIKRFHLLSEGHFLPASEDIALLKNGETIRVKPNISQSESILLADTYYDRNNTIYKRMNMSEDISPIRVKRRKNSSSNNAEADKEVIFPIVEDKKEEQCINKDHFNKGFISNTTTHDNADLNNISNTSTQIKHMKNIMETSSSESKIHREKLKKSNHRMDYKLKVRKPKKKVCKESEKETSFKEGSRQISELKNQELITDVSKDLQTYQKNIHFNCNEDMHYTKPIPYKKAKLKSWSNSPPLKSTNIVQITKMPIEKIDIDLTRFVFIPDDNLPPLEPINIDVKNTNNVTEKLDGDFSIVPQKYSEKQQSFANESQCNIELMARQTFHEEFTEVKSQNFLEMSDINSQNLLTDTLQQVKSDKSNEESQQIKALNSFDTPNIPNISNQMQLQKCFNELEHLESLHCSPESHESKLSNSQDALKQNVHSNSCPGDDSTKLMQLQNFSCEIKQNELHNVSDSLQQVSEESELAESRNISELSQQTRLGNVSELATTLEESKKTISCSNQDESDVSDSRYKQRERWKRQIEKHTRDILSMTNLLSDSSLLHSEGTSKIEKSKGLLNANENQKTNDNKKNLLEKDAMEYTENVFKGDANIIEISSDSRISHKTTYDNNSISLEKNAMCSAENLVTENAKINEKNMEVTDCAVNLSIENSKPTSEVASDSTMSLETTADDASFPNPRRRRRKRYRKKTKVEKAFPRQEKINVFPPQWSEFIPGKPRIHLRFKSSDDDIPQEMNEHVVDLPTTSAEKIKILQDVTINPDGNCHIDDKDNKVGVQLVGQDGLLADRYEKTSEYCNPSELSSDGNDYLQKLLQLKKEELLKTVDSFTLIH